MSSSQTPDIREVRAEVAYIKRMVAKLYNRPISQEPMVNIVVPTIHVCNIWAILDQVEKLVEEPREEKIEIKKRKYAMK